jgi:hypothetical protein
MDTQQKNMTKDTSRTCESATYTQEKIGEVNRTTGISQLEDRNIRINVSPHSVSQKKVAHEAKLTLHNEKRAFLSQRCVNIHH